MYDPPLSTVADYHAMATTLGIERMVIVQASIYDTDNSCLLDSIAELGKRNTRGIAVVDQSITMEELKNMDAIGVRGIRFNAITGHTPIEWLPSLAHMIEPLGWHIQLWIKSARLLEISSLLKQISVPIVLDHMGQFPVREGTTSSEFQNILRLLDGGNCWLKLTAYRVSQAAPSFTTSMVRDDLNCCRAGALSLGIGLAAYLPGRKTDAEYGGSFRSYLGMAIRARPAARVRR